MERAQDVAVFTCIRCPIGCPVEVTFAEDGSVADVQGNSCKRGADYAVQEAVSPERIVTAVVPAQGCLEPLSVKTERPVPKDRMADVLALVRGLQVQAPVEAGEVVAADACGTGVAIIATKSIP